MAKKQSGKKGSKGDTHGKKDIAKLLGELNEIWEDVDPVSFEDVADGKYQTLLSKIEINESKSSGRLQVSWQLKIASGEFANRMIFKHDGIDTAESLGYFKGGLARLGVECPDDMQELPEVLDELKDTFASVTVRTKKGSDIANVYFDKALDSDDIEEDLSEDPDAAGTEEAEEAEELVWEKGEKCEVDIDGTNYPGVVTTVNEDDSTALITFDDGDTDTYAFADLIEIEGKNTGDEAAEAEEPDPEPEVEEDEPWAKGDECQVDIDGTMYNGKIKSIKDDVAKIVFDDGDTDSYPLDDLVEIEAEESEETEEAEETEETAEGDELKLAFEEDMITEALQTKIEKLSKDHEFNPDDYENYKDLLIDIGEYLDIGGEFKTPKEIIAAISKSA